MSYQGITNVFYTESCPDVDYALRWLQDNYNCSISPLHCQDRYESGSKVGQFKKPHYHIIILNKVSVKNRKFINSILGLSENHLWQDISDLASMEEYQTHSGFTDDFKVEYDKTHLIHSSEYHSHFLQMVKKDFTVEYWGRVKTIIESEQIKEISTFFDYVYDNFATDGVMFNFCFKNNIRIKHYIDSIRYRDNYHYQLQEENTLIRKQLVKAEHMVEVLKHHNDRLYKEFKRAKLDSEIKRNYDDNMYSLAYELEIE